MGNKFKTRFCRNMIYLQSGQPHGVAPTVYCKICVHMKIIHNIYTSFHAGGYAAAPTGYRTTFLHRKDETGNHIAVYNIFAGDHTGSPLLLRNNLNFTITPHPSGYAVHLSSLPLRSAISGCHRQPSPRRQRNEIFRGFTILSARYCYIAATGVAADLWAEGN